MSTQRKDGVRAVKGHQEERPQGPLCLHPCPGLAVSRNCEQIRCCCSSHLLCGILLWQPLQLSPLVIRTILFGAAQLCRAVLQAFFD